MTVFVFVYLRMFGGSGMCGVYVCERCLEFCPNTNRGVSGRCSRDRATNRSEDIALSLKNLVI